MITFMPFVESTFQFSQLKKRTAENVFYTHCLMRCFISRSVRDLFSLDGANQNVDGDYA